MRSGKRSAKTGTSASFVRDDEPPTPFRRAPESLQAFIETLSKKHVYITHVDYKPRVFKRKIFAVSVVINIVVASLFVWRTWRIGPFYLQLLTSTLGYENGTTFRAAELSWSELIAVVLRRTLTFMLDFCLFVFVWPWPYDFCFGRTRGSPVQWRRRVGFRDREIYVRRSRTWSRNVGDPLVDGEARSTLLSHLVSATTPRLVQDKTGYLTQNGEWDLDWTAMVHATRLVDDRKLAHDAFGALILLHHHDYGWLCMDIGLADNATEDERRRNVYAFRDALTAVGKEDLFFRWVDTVQTETSKHDTFTEERQLQVAKQVRDLFEESGIDFDQFWKQSVEGGMADM